MALPLKPFVCFGIGFCLSIRRPTFHATLQGL